MNAPIPAAELEKRRFTVADIWALIAKGIVQEDAKFELLDGEIIPMSPKGPLHEQLRYAVNRWVRGLPDRLAWMVETTLYLDEESFVEPDYVVFDASVPIQDLKPAEVLLAIEVADSSWAYDTLTKAPRYSAAGVQEYWAIHASRRIIRVHRGPGPQGWVDVREIPGGEALIPLCAPELAFRLSE